MSDILNNPQCAASGNSTGIPSCPINPDIIVGAILTDPNKVYTLTDLADLKAAMIASVMATGTNRIHPIFRFVELTDGTEAETIVTMGYGPKIIVKEGAFDWTFRFMKGGLCFNANLRSFNDLEKAVIFVDNTGKLYGVKTDEGGLRGFALDQVFTANFKLNDGSAPNKYVIRFLQSNPKEWDTFAMYDPKAQTVPWDAETALKGILDIELVEVSSGNGEATFKVQTKCDKVNLYDDFSTELADKVLWTLETSAGDSVTITTLVAVPASKSFQMTFTGTGSHVVNLVSSALLAAAGIGGSPSNPYECSALTFTAGS